MSPLQRILISVAAALILAVPHAADAQTDVDQDCLECLCHAASRCDANEKCHVPYVDGYFCGPFHISYGYWADAGKPVIQSDDPEAKGSFENCVNDLYCATDTVRQYWRNFGEDCNGDGKMTCEDVVRLHKFGKNLCRQHLKSDDPSTRQYYECADRFGLP